MPVASAIAAGKLRQRVTLEECTESADAVTNEPVETWKAFGTYWAAVEPVRGNERFASLQIQSSVTHAITIRTGPPVTAKWRARHDGRLMYVQEPPIDVDERGRKTILMCQERTEA